MRGITLEWYYNGYWHKWRPERHEKIQIIKEHLRRKQKKRQKKAWQKKQKEANVFLYTLDLILVPTNRELSRFYFVGVLTVHLVSTSTFSMNFNSSNYHKARPTIKHIIANPCETAAGSSRKTNMELPLHLIVWSTLQTGFVFCLNIDPLLCHPNWIVHIDTRMIFNQSTIVWITTLQGLLTTK